MLLRHINASNDIIHEEEAKGLCARWSDSGTYQALSKILSKKLCGVTAHDAPEAWSDGDRKSITEESDTFAAGSLFAAIIIWPNFSKDRRLEPFIGVII